MKPEPRRLRAAASAMWSTRRPLAFSTSSANMCIVLVAMAIASTGPGDSLRLCDEPVPDEVPLSARKALGVGLEVHRAHHDRRGMIPAQRLLHALVEEPIVFRGGDPAHAPDDSQTPHLVPPRAAARASTNALTLFCTSSAVVMKEHTLMRIAGPPPSSCPRTSILLNAAPLQGWTG